MKLLLAGVVAPCAHSLILATRGIFLLQFQPEMSTMKPIQLFDTASSTYTYVLFDPISREAVIIDPVDTQIERDLQVLRDYGLKLVWALETHAHADHITSAGMLAELAGAKTTAPADCGIESAAVQLHDHDTLAIWRGVGVGFAHTRPHGRQHVFCVARACFTGDTLLINGCGRTDFQSGSATALYHSLTQVLFALPDSTTVWPGHDYQGRSCSSIGQEKTGNARVAGKSAWPSSPPSWTHCTCPGQRAWMKLCPPTCTWGCAMMRPWRTPWWSAMPMVTQVTCR
jgi:glyoxylase-like metal-dependent hydrolase (beta-lactamase superfamily II)